MHPQHVPHQPVSHQHVRRWRVPSLPGRAREPRRAACGAAVALALTGVGLVLVVDHSSRASGSTEGFRTSVVAQDVAGRSVTATSWRGTYVADAAASAVLVVDVLGQVATVAALPATRVEVTWELAGVLGLSASVVGHEVPLPSTPDDLVVGPGGILYVATSPRPVPGAPGERDEGNDLDGRSTDLAAVHRIDPVTGATRRVANGFDGAIDLTIHRDGTVYVTQSDGAAYVLSRRGAVVPVAAVPAEPRVGEPHSVRRASRLTAEAHVQIAAPPTSISR